MAASLSGCWVWLVVGESSNVAVVVYVNMVLNVHRNHEAY